MTHPSTVQTRVPVSSPALSPYQVQNYGGPFGLPSYRFLSSETGPEVELPGGGYHEPSSRDQLRIADDLQKPSLWEGVGKPLITAGGLYATEGIRDNLNANRFANPDASYLGSRGEAASEFGRDTYDTVAGGARNLFGGFGGFNAPDLTTEGGAITPQAYSDTFLNVPSATGRAPSPAGEKPSAPSIFAPTSMFDQNYSLSANLNYELPGMTFGFGAKSLLRILNGQSVGGAVKDAAISEGIRFVGNQIFPGLGTVAGIVNDFFGFF